MCADRQPIGPRVDELLHGCDVSVLSVSRSNTRCRHSLPFRLLVCLRLLGVRSGVGFPAHISRLDSRLHTCYVLFSCSCSDCIGTSNCGVFCTMLPMPLPPPPPPPPPSDWVTSAIAYDSDCTGMKCWSIFSVLCIRLTS